jgi:hypothetical protein
MQLLLARSFFITLLLSGAVVAQSQPEPPLGDVARANRAQQQAREADGSMPKVITKENLPADPPGVPPSTSSQPMTMVSGVKRSDRNADERLSKRLQAEQRTGEQWKTRIEEQQNRIADLQAQIDRVNASIHSAVGTAQYETPVNRYQAIQMERLAAMQENLDQQKRRLDIIEDAARRAGVDQ